MVFLYLFVTLLVIFNHVIPTHQNIEDYINRGCDYTHRAQDLDADFVIGALIPVHQLQGNTYKFNTYGVTWVEGFLLAIDQINKNKTLLPGVKLGYDIRDTCNSPQVATKQTLDFITDIAYYSRATMENNVTSYTMEAGMECKCVDKTKSKLIGIVGGASSSVSSSSSYLLGTNKVPQISYAATSPSLSDKKLFPNFLRTVPSDLAQTIAMSELMEYFKWTYVSVLASDDEYGRLAIDKLRQNLRNKGVCFAVDRLFDPQFPGRDLDQITDSLQQSYPASKVVIIWSNLDSSLSIIKSAKKRGMNDTLWVLGTETWGTDLMVKNANIKDLRIMRLKISDIKVRSFISHMKNEVTYQSYLNNTWIRQLWPQLGICEEYPPYTPKCFKYTPSGSFIPNARHENLIAAAYAFGYGLHVYLQCNTTWCNRSLIEDLNYSDFLSVLKRPGNRFMVPTSDMFVKFDVQGDAIVNAYNFELLNGKSAAMKFGQWNGETNSIDIDDEFLWKKYAKEKPNATCAYQCQPGTYKVPGQSACCWQCVPCPYEQISDMIDAAKCYKCSAIKVANARQDRCIPLRDTKLSIRSSPGKIVVACSFIAFLITAFVLCVFLRYWNTPVVKSASREISVIQLVCMLLLFCYPTLHMVTSSIALCIVRKVLFGSLHILILAFILLKTYRLLRVFQPKRFSKISKFLHNRYQVMTSFLFVGILLLFLVTWYFNHAPTVDIHTDKLELVYIYHCSSHDDILQYVIVCYIIILSIASGFMAFRARRLPSNFNEAQYIWLAMFTCVLAWVMFFPLYSTQKIYKKPLVEIGVNGASTFCLLIVLYAYRIRIILFKPHLNSQEHFSKLASNATVTTFLKEVNPVALEGGAVPTSQRQSVISFDFDGMFDEYKKQKERKMKESMRQSFKHFPKTFRLSMRISKKEKKQKAKERIKAKNRTLQLQKQKRVESLRGMPPKSASFDDNEILSQKHFPKQEFFIDGLDLNSSQGSRVGSNASLIHQNNEKNTKTKEDKLTSINAQSNVIIINANQSSIETFL